MKRHTTKFAVLDVCPECDGTFFDRGEGVAALDASAEVNFLIEDGRAERLGPGTLRCPAHGTRAVEAYRGSERLEPDAKAPTMDRYEVRGKSGPIEVDVCSSCRGFFLDAGEPEALLALAAKTSPDEGLRGLVDRLFEDGDPRATS